MPLANYHAQYDYYLSLGFIAKNCFRHLATPCFLIFLLLQIAPAVCGGAFIRADKAIAHKSRNHFYVNAVLVRLARMIYKKKSVFQNVAARMRTSNHFQLVWSIAHASIGEKQDMPMIQTVHLIHHFFNSFLFRLNKEI